MKPNLQLPEFATGNFGRSNQRGGLPPTRDATGGDATGGFPGVSYPSPGSKYGQEELDKRKS
eukprot:8393879-Pyramimonas_sp.AAC.1